MPSAGDGFKGIKGGGLPFALFLLLGFAGVSPDTSKRRAFSAAWRASTSDTVGYLPIVNVFSLPSIRYFRRKIFPPAGVTSKYNPPPSNSLVFFPVSVGLAFLIWRSFSFIFTVFFRGIFSRYFSDTAKDTVNFGYFY